MLIKQFKPANPPKDWENQKVDKKLETIFRDEGEGVNQFRKDITAAGLTVAEFIASIYYIIETRNIHAHGSFSALPPNCEEKTIKDALSIIKVPKDDWYIFKFKVLCQTRSTT